MERSNGLRPDTGKPAGRALTDLGNAERLVDRHGKHTIYVPEWGWLRFDGKRWKRVDVAAIEALMQQVARAIHAEAAEADSRADANATAKHATATESTPRIRAAVTAARALLLGNAEGFDHDPWVVNLQNGTFDFRTHELRSHRPADHITKVTNGAYEPAASGKEWDGFLHRVQDDAERRAWLQRQVGYGLTGSTREEVLFGHRGLGANGKSTFLKAIAHAAGDYATYVDPTTLAYDPRRSPQRFDLAPLAGVRIAIAVETAHRSRKLDEGLLKRLTSREPIVGEYKHKDQFRFTPSHKLLWAFNDPPTISSDDLGTWRRITMTPWPVTLQRTEWDLELDDKLRLEADAILTWAIEGALVYLREGLNPPEAVQVATEQYRAEQDPLGEFLATRCVVNDTVEVRAAALFEAYQRYADSERISDRDRLSQTAFGRRMSTRFQKATSSRGALYHGIGVRA